MTIQPRTEAFAPVVAQARLADIRDSLVLALDASEKRHGYTQAEREARSHVRAALRQTDRLIGGEV